MIEKMELLVHLIVCLLRLMKPGGLKVVMAETMAMKQQLIVMNRGRSRSPKLTTSDRFLFGLLAFIIDEKDCKRWPSLSGPPLFLVFTELW